MVGYPIISDRFEGVAQVRDGWAALVSLDVTPVGTVAPVLKASVHNSPAMSLGTFEGSAVRLMRTRALAEDSQNDVIMCIEGRTHIRVEAPRAKERDLSPGDVHVWRADRPMRCEPAGGFSALMVALPQSLLSDHRVDCEPALRADHTDAFPKSQAPTVCAGAILRLPLYLFVLRNSGR